MDTTKIGKKMNERQTIPLSETLFGYELRTPYALAVFGNRNSSIEQLKLAYPELLWSQLKQTHGNTIVEGDSKFLGDLRPEADAQWTKYSGLGICISTADCVPVFLFGSGTSGIRIAGIHAGWRGVANALVIKTIKEFIEAGIDPKSISVLIGPHIQKYSFEIRSDALDKLTKSIPKTSLLTIDDFAQFISIDRYLFDLNLLVKEQVKSQGLGEEQISCLMIDTKTDIRFHSFRRDKEATGRQISFMALL